MVKVGSSVRIENSFGGYSWYTVKYIRGGYFYGLEDDRGVFIKEVIKESFVTFKIKR